MRLFLFYFLASLLLAAAPALAYADRGEGEGGVAGALGWVAIGAGALGTVPFLLYVRVKKLSVVALGGGDAITRELALQHRPILNVHMALNLVGFAAGAVHGYVLLGGLDAVSLSLAVVMTVLAASGMIMRFSSRNVRAFTRLLHGQMVMSALLVVLIALHVSSMLD